MKSLKLLFLALSVSIAVSPAAAEAFGGGTTSPQPNVTDLSIYRVTDLTTSEKETGGTLVDSGLNKTFWINHNSSEQYRFSFRIENSGMLDWTLESADELFHNDLSSAWTVDKIWYNISQDYDGGTFSNRKVSWNTDQGGSAGTLTAGSVMYAKYLVTIDDSDYDLSQRFLVNDTSSSSGSYDYHDLKVQNLGELNVTLEEPVDGTILRQNRTFLMNATVSCTGGTCGEVDASPRYNESSVADTVIPLTGEPFNTNDSLKTCSSSLGSGESCRVEFYVNASGSDPSSHLLDVNASSNYTIPEANSPDAQVSIETVLLFDLNWSAVSFGAVSPGSENVSAQGNDGRDYNVSVDEDSVEIDDMWIRATDLQSAELDYRIPAENLSYSLTNDISTESFLSNSYQLLKSNISPGSVFSTYYWIDVPTGIYNGGYEGSIYFKANSSS